jgi:hypothetical protein
LTLEHLRDAFFMQAADRYLKFGIPDDMADSLKGAEKELLVPREQYELSSPLPTSRNCCTSVARRLPSTAVTPATISRDLRMLEPIGTGLADWGRKEPAKLAFEHIAQYLEHGHGHAGHGEAWNMTDGHAWMTMHAFPTSIRVVSCPSSSWSSWPMAIALASFPEAA